MRPWTPGSALLVLLDAKSDAGAALPPARSYANRVRGVVTALLSCCVVLLCEGLCVCVRPRATCTASLLLVRSSPRCVLYAVLCCARRLVCGVRCGNSGASARLCSSPQSQSRRSRVGGLLLLLWCGRCADFSRVVRLCCIIMLLLLLPPLLPARCCRQVWRHNRQHTHTPSSHAQAKHEQQHTLAVIRPFRRAP